MRMLRILGLAALGLFVVAQDAMARRRGGAVSGGMRGAVVGGMVGGGEAAATGAKVGAVTGATRAAIDRESQAHTSTRPPLRTRMPRTRTSAKHRRSVLGATPTGTATKPSGEAVIRKNDKPIVGITFPADWKQRTGDNYISAVSGDGHAYTMLVTADGIAGKQAGIKKVQAGLENYLEDIKFDEPSETKGGALLTTGTGKAKKAGVDVVFAAGVFDAGNGQFVGAAFVVDSKVEDHYKETVRGICQTLRRADDLNKN